MDIQIHNVNDKKWKTILIKHGIAFLSNQSYNTVQRFEAAIKNSANSENIEAFPLSNIQEMKFNDKSGEVDFKYLDKYNYKKLVTLKIGHENHAQDFGHKLGAELGMHKNVSVEKKWQIIVKNSVFVILAFFLPMIIYSKVDNMKENIWLFVGLIIAGVSICVFDIFRKLRKPTNYTRYTKSDDTLSLNDQPLKLKLPLLEKK